VVPDGTQLPAILGRLRDRASSAVLARLADRRALVRNEGRALQGAGPDLGAARQRAGDLLDRGQRALEQRTVRERAVLDGMFAGLQALGPGATLARGYAVARRPDGRIVRSSREVAIGEALEIVLGAGRLGAEVHSTSDEGAEELLA
jgi:exodeoxyribonuclease VII large subunit